MDGDPTKLDDLVLAMLYVNVMMTGTARKGFDWDSLNRLHARGLISTTQAHGSTRRACRPARICRGCGRRSLHDAERGELVDEGGRHAYRASPFRHEGARDLGRHRQSPAGRLADLLHPDRPRAADVERRWSTT